jgi:membrane-associated protein
VERTSQYLQKYGPARAVMFARFVPIVRTLMNPLVGVVRMDLGAFTVANVVGGTVWTVGVTLAGYVLGRSVHNIDHYILPIIALIIAVSLIPVGVEVRRSRAERREKVAP